MSEAEAVERTPWAIPPEALTEWLRLAAVVDEIGAVPCRTSDPEAWWPDRNAIDGYEAQAAIEACRACPARAACLDYALVGRERFGIWGAATPQEREGMPRTVHTVETHQHRTFVAGCPDCRRAHTRRVREWRRRREYAETTKAS